MPRWLLEVHPGHWTVHLRPTSPAIGTIEQYDVRTYRAIDQRGRVLAQGLWSLEAALKVLRAMKSER
jgi:hypothetical protein